MKKKMIIICSVSIILVLVIVLLFTKVFNKNTDLKNTYLTIISKKTSFILNKKKMNIDDLLKDGEYDISFYSFVDYGNDSHLEFYVALYGINEKGYIFNYTGNKMYAYETDDYITYNTVDGYSSFSGEKTGWVKYTISGKKLKKEYLILHDQKSNKCSVENKDYDCSKIVDEEIKLLDKIGEKAEEIRVENKKQV